jgi:large subunit ribosomal protein L35
MPKVKTSKAVAKRFRKTKSGRIKHGCAHKVHILTKKKRKRIRRLRQQDMVSKTDLVKIQRLLPY